jgi:hypothetical protein
VAKSPENPAGLNLGSGIFRDERYRALDAVDVPGLRDRVTNLYGVAPDIGFVEIAEIVDNAHA